MCVFTHTVYWEYASRSMPPHESKDCWHAGQWVCKSRRCSSFDEDSLVCLNISFCSTCVSVLFKNSIDLHVSVFLFLFFHKSLSLVFCTSLPFFLSLSFALTTELSEYLSQKFRLPSNRVVLVAAGCHNDSL